MARITVVGAGIMGLSVARSAVKAGHQVTVLERASIADDGIASVDETRLIRHPYGAQDGYAHRVNPAFEAWTRLWDDLGRSHYQPTGTLCLAEGGGAGALERSAAGVEALGLAVERLCFDEIRTRFSPLAPPPEARGFYVATGGTLAAKTIVTDLAGWLRARGALLRSGTPVKAFDAQEARCTLGTGEEISGDYLVLAAGAWTSVLTDGAISVTPSRQAVLYVSVPEAYVDDWAKMPITLSIDPGSSGSYWVPSARGRSLKIGDHSFRPGGHPDAPRELRFQELQEVMRKGTRWLRDPDGYPHRAGRACYYALAPEERFMVRAIAERSWVMAGFSGHGFKFGPLLGEEVVAAIDGVLPPQEVERRAAGFSPASAS